MPVGNYGLNFKFCSPTGYSNLGSYWSIIFKLSACNMPQDVYCNDQGLIYTSTDTSAVLLNDETGSGTLSDRNFTIYASGTTPVYLAINCGNLYDGVSYQFKFSDYVLSLNGKTYMTYADQDSTVHMVREEGGTVKLKAIWEPTSITLPTTERDGYTFMGWNTESDGTGDSYNAGDEYTPTADQTLYAMWKPKSESTLPDNIFNPTCAVEPDSSAFDIEEKFTISGTHSMTAPLVGDIDGDGTPEILVLQPYTYSGSNKDYIHTQNIMVVDGKTHEKKYTINTTKCDIYGTKLTFADVDKDGKAEIFVQDFSHIVYCYTYDGTQIWKSTSLDHAYQLSVADVNGDGTAELVVGHYIFDAKTGTLLVNGTMTSTGTGYCSPHTMDHMPYSSWNSYKNLAFHAYGLYDFDKDGQLELCAGNSLYKINITNNSGTEGNTWELLREMPANDSIATLDGSTIVADFDNDGDADIIVVAQPDVTASYRTIDFYVWDGQTDQLISHAKTENTSHGASLPFAGDMNNDGKLEVAFNRPAGFYEFTYDEKEEGHIKALAYNEDKFKETTSFTAFDFNQDGKDEFVYRNESTMSISDGTTFADLCTPMPSYSGTMMEFPVVADIDGDGHAEILLNRSLTKWAEPYSNYGGELVVYGSKKPGAWSSARKVWNQYPYNVVNINEDLTVPTVQFDIVTKFATGKKPFNAVQKQLPYMDKDGNLFNLAADLTIVDKGHKITGNCEGFTIDSLTIENIGEIASLEELTLKVTDVVADTAIWNDTLKSAVLEINKQKAVNLNIPVKNQLGKKIKIEVNPAGDRQQPECNYENNNIELVIPALETVDSISYDTICVPAGIVLKGGYDQIDTTTNGCDTTFIKYIHYNQSYLIREWKTDGWLYLRLERTLINGNRCLLRHIACHNWM